MEEKNKGGRPLKYKTVKKLEEAIQEYFETDAYDEEGDKRIFCPTISGLAYHLDIATETLRRYEHKDKFSATIKRAKQLIEISLERKLSGNAVTGTIFNLKNNFGWKDKQEIDNTSSDGSATPKVIILQGVRADDISNG